MNTLELRRQYRTDILWSARASGKQHFVPGERISRKLNLLCATLIQRALLTISKWALSKPVTTLYFRKKLAIAVPKTFFFIQQQRQRQSIAYRNYFLSVMLWPYLQVSWENAETRIICVKRFSSQMRTKCSAEWVDRLIAQCIK